MVLYDYSSYHNPTELSYRIILQNYPTLLTIYGRDPQVDVGPSGGRGLGVW